MTAMRQQARRRRTARHRVALALAFVCGCQGGTTRGAPGPANADGSRAVSSKPEPGGGFVKAKGPIISPDCASAVFGSTAAPMRRLSEREYRNTVAALFPGVELPSLEVVGDARVDTFANAAQGQAPSALAVERYSQTAGQVAEAAVAQLGAWAACPGETPQCAHRTLLALAERAYRRPLSQQERSDLRALTDRALSIGPPRLAMQIGIESLLQSPGFLYRPEFGTQTRVGPRAVALSGRELATRLAYFLLASPPDAELLAAADAGRLATDEGLRAEAKRMLADPRARAALDDFFLEWLGVYKLEALALEKALFPELDTVLRSELYASVAAFVDYALWEQDSYRALMTSSVGFVNDRLAPLFGVPPPGTDQLTRVNLDPHQRRGVLTQPGVLASTSHGIRHSPILRGVAVLNRLMCADLPPPPPNVNMAEDLIVDESAICTTRDEVSMTHTAKRGCIACHDAIDSAGFIFEHYDALGRYRNQEHGCGINARGSYPGTDLHGEFQNAVALATLLPESRTVTRCLATQLFSYGLGRKPGEADRCEIETLAAPLLRGSDSLQDLILALVTTPSFRSTTTGN